MKVIVAGGGIGGLTLAAALRRQAVDVVVLERTAALGAGGSGITVQPNAMHALRRIGIDEAVSRAGRAIVEAAILDPGGRPLSPPIDLVALAAELGAPTIALHRRRLHEALLTAAGADVVRAGAALASFVERDGKVVARLADGEEIEGDLLVGADGLRSTVRAALLADGEPAYAGYTTWRGITPAEAVEPPTRTTETWGRGERFGIVPIGHGEVYWFATANAPAGGADGDVRAELARRFGSWHAPIARVLEATPAERILRTDASDRPTIRRWHRGRVVLLGDAAHPMTPNFGQGGCQAIEDAVVLAECLAARGEVAHALADYERRRVDRANAIVVGSRRMGALAQWEHPLACRLRAAILRATPASAALRRMRTILSFPG